MYASYAYALYIPYALCTHKRASDQIHHHTNAYPLKYIYQAKAERASKYAFGERSYAPLETLDDGSKRGAGYQVFFFSFSFFFFFLSLDYCELRLDYNDTSYQMGYKRFYIRAPSGLM